MTPDLAARILKLLADVESLSLETLCFVLGTEAQAAVDRLVADGKVTVKRGMVRRIS